VEAKTKNIIKTVVIIVAVPSFISIGWLLYDHVIKPRFIDKSKKTKESDTTKTGSGKPADTSAIKTANKK
jgi:hypothetical protein